MRTAGAAEMGGQKRDRPHGRTAGGRRMCLYGQRGAAQRGVGEPAGQCLQVYARRRHGGAGAALRCAGRDRHGATTAPAWTKPPRRASLTSFIRAILPTRPRATASAWPWRRRSPLARRAHHGPKRPRPRQCVHRAPAAGRGLRNMQKAPGRVGRARRGGEEAGEEAHFFWTYFRQSSMTATRMMMPENTNCRLASMPRVVRE